jgi:2-keto-4-pentenoate hydratase/2-oxohepta-3-ene-1,7-dioic acid hydratase in catechol pathway
MKLITYLSNGALRTGAVVADNAVVDISAAGSALQIMMDAGARANAAKLAASGARTMMSSLDLLMPIAPAKIVAIGLNYRDHAAETNQPIPQKPVVFAKFPNSLANPNATLTFYSDMTKEIDFEAELGIVIGKTAYRVSEANALSYVGGYVCANDVSARDLQKTDEQKQWVLGKSFDDSCPIGPMLVTSDEVPDPQKLAIKCILNGQVVQSSNTAQMIFGTAQLVSYLSHYMTLNVGDLIVTGTPPGVGMARTPRLWMKDGDEVVIEIEKLGSLRNRIRVI